MFHDEKRAKLDIRVTFEQYEILARIARSRSIPSAGELIEKLIEKSLAPQPVAMVNNAIMQFPSEKRV
jgi:hypothetical protein